MAPILTDATDTAEAASSPPPTLLTPPPEKPVKKTAIEEDEEKEEKAEKGGNISPTLLKLKNASEMETKAWLDAISGEAAIKVKLSRREPKTHRDPETGEMVKVDGQLASFDRTIDEEEIQRLHGGGTFQLVVQTRNNKGQWSYFGAKTFEIAGDPNIKGVPRTHVPPKDQTPQIMMPQKDPATEKILDRMVGHMIEQSHRPAPPPVSSGIDPMTMQAMIKPLEIQIQSLMTQLSAAHAETARVRETAGKDPFRDKMLDTLMGGESSRIITLNEAHASEIRQLKEHARADLERERERHTRDLERMEKAHERELAALTASNAQAIAMAGQKTDVTKMVLEGQNKQLEKQVERLETELTTLRAKKEQSIKEKVDELQAIKELVGDGDDEETSTFERIIGAVGNLPAVVGMAERVANGGAQQQPPQAAPPKKNQVVRDKATGDVSLLTPDGRLMPLKKKPVAVTTEGGQQVEIPSLDPEQVKQAVSYMENAYRSGTDPETFAATARPFVPAPILGAMRTLGIHEFLTKVGKIDGTSVLATMRGRQWAKKVAAALMGSDDQSADPPADPAPDPATPQPEA